MTDDAREHDEATGEDLLRRALLDASASTAVSMRVTGLAVADAVTIIFHARRDLGTIQTYLTPGGREAGTEVSASELLRVPCDLDLAAAEDRDEAESLYAEQARDLRDAIVAADTVMSVWREPLADVAGSDIGIDYSVELPIRWPAARFMPVALVAHDRGLVVGPVCGARTLADGRPPLGIACAQQDLAAIYPLPDDPERCLDDFLDRAAAHAHDLAARLDQQEASIQRFLEISGDD
jgi:hypothetical protein